MASLAYKFSTVSIANLVSDGYIAMHPVEARERIEAYYECRLRLSGHGCDGIALLRDLIQSVDHNSKLSRCLLISAPHTHWGTETIVESFDADRAVYIAGPAQPNTDLRPYSFVFTPDGPIPYEWADETVPLGAADWNQPYAAIIKLGDMLAASPDVCLPMPLGISIAHRFKRSIWDQQVFTSAEGPHSEEGGRAIIRPVLESVIYPNPMNPHQVQVAWSAYPTAEIVEPPFDNEETTVLGRFEDLLRRHNTEAALDIVKEIEEALASE